MGRKRTGTIVGVVLLVTLSTLSIPVFGATQNSQTDCQPPTETLDIDNAFSNTERETVGATAFSDSSNTTSFNAEEGTARIEATADSSLGWGAVGGFGQVAFAWLWTAPCTGLYNFSVTYDMSIAVEQHREVSTVGNGVTRAGAMSRIIVSNVTEFPTVERVKSTNKTEWDTIIPRLEDLEDDALVNYFSAVVNRLLGVPVGEQVAGEVGIERNATDLQDSVTRTNRRISVTFQADKGEEIDFLHLTEAAAIAAGVAGGGSSGSIAVDVDVDEATVSPAGGSIGDSNGRRNDGRADDSNGKPGSQTLQLIADSDANVFQYSIEVDGDVTLGAAADPETGDSITRNADGTVTIHGTAGEGGTDTYQFTGEVICGSLGGPGEVRVDGVREPLNSCSQGPPSRTLRVVADSTAPVFSYTIRIDGDAALGREADPETGDSITRNTDGTVTIHGTAGEGGVDSYQITGEVVCGSLNGPGEISVDGRVQGMETCDSSKPEYQILRVTADSDASVFAYSIRIDGKARLGDAANPDTGDSITRNADGTVTIHGTAGEGGTDTYRITGNVICGSLGGPGEVRIDGIKKQLNPCT